MKKFAAFDIDGTLIRWQLYHAVVDRLAKKGLLGKNARDKLHKARMVWKRREHPDAFHEYERLMIKVYEKALPSLTAREFDDAAEEVAHEYKTQIYTYTRDLAKSLKQKGYVLIAISGSHTELVEHVARQYGFDLWIGSDYHRENERFSGKKEIASLDKAAVLKRIISKHNLDTNGSYAIGDSRSDAPMLELVENPIAFNPDKNLLSIAKSCGWPIVIERKNVIYKLENRDGKYILA